MSSGHATDENARILDAVAAVAAVAATVRDSDDGLGVFYSPRTRTVFWSGGDSDFDETFLMTPWASVRDRLLAIDGVDAVELAAETLPDEEEPGEPGPGWQRIAYERCEDVIAYDQWFLTDVMHIPARIVEETYGQPLLAPPADCAAWSASRS